MHYINHAYQPPSPLQRDDHAKPGAPALAPNNIYRTASALAGAGHDDVLQYHPPALPQGRSSISNGIGNRSADGAEQYIRNLI